MSGGVTNAGAAQATALPLASSEQRARIEATAKEFEGQLLAMMLQPMFQGLSTGGPFGGGFAEGTYRSFMVDAFGKQMAKVGGIGLAGPVMHEMLKMQGLQ
jgi:flagellar protein FlgJ